MKQKSGPDKAPAEQVLKDIRRQTRRQYSAEDNIRIVLEGLRGEESIGAAPPVRHRRLDVLRLVEEFLEAGKRRLAGDTARAATSGEVKDLRREAAALKEVVADLTLENRLLKKSMSGDGEDEASDILHPRGPRSSSWSSNRICRPSAPWTNSASPVLRSTAGMTDIVKAALRRWLTTVPDQIVSGIAFQMMSAARSSRWHWRFLSCRRGGWQCASPTSKSTLYRRLRSIVC